jgi:MoaE-MoaD fusion protein
MRVRVLLFGVLKELAGKAVDSVELPDGASVAELMTRYGSQMPQLGNVLSSLAVAVNEQYAGPQTELKADDEVALLPPVSGGSAAESGVDQGKVARGEAAQSKVAQPGLSAAAARRRARIQREAIVTEAELARLKRGEDGAAVVFEGVVRNQTRGRKTLYLEYEAYESMALEQMEALGEQALKQFAIRDVALVHRLGRLEIGETSVLIVVVSAHRAAAFEACRWLIDTLKQTVPIWKKEFFDDGAVWADGEPFPPEIQRANPAAPGSPVVRRASK